MLKKIFKCLLVLVMMLSMVACSSSDSDSGSDSDGTTTYKIALLVPYLGDQSYFDTTAAGLDDLEAAYDNVETVVVEMGTDASKYEEYFDDVCSSGQYDLVVSGGTDCE